MTSNARITALGYPLFARRQKYSLRQIEILRKHSYDIMLEEECIYSRKPKTISEASLLIDHYIHFYNHERIQLNTKLTPLDKRRQYD